MKRQHNNIYPHQTLTYFKIIFIENPLKKKKFVSVLNLNLNPTKSSTRDQKSSIIKNQLTRDQRLPELPIKAQK